MGDDEQEDGDDEEEEGGDELNRGYLEREDRYLGDDRLERVSDESSGGG